MVKVGTFRYNGFDHSDRLGGCSPIIRGFFSIKLRVHSFFDSDVWSIMGILLQIKM